MVNFGESRLALGVAVVVGLCVSGTAWPLGAQVPTVRSGVTLVPVDVRVVDKEGKPVVGLTRDNFVVSEDGVPQAITFFEERALSAPPAVAGSRVLMPGATTPMGFLPEKRRVFLIALERAWLSDIPFAGVEALTRFLRERLTSNDYAAVSAFGRMTNLTNDHKALADVVERLLLLQKSIDRRNAKSTEGMALFMLASTPNIFPDWSLSVRRSMRSLLQHRPESTARRNITANLKTSSIGLSMNSGRPSSGQVPHSGSLVETVAAPGRPVSRFIEGEKHLVYPFTLPSFLSFDSDQNIARIASNARVSIDFIKANGLEAYSGRSGMVDWANFSRMEAEMSFKNVASISGGQVFLDRYPEEAYASIDATTRASYLLAYSPTNATRDGRYHKIKVEVKGVRNATVINRQSYLATEKVEEYDAEQYAARDRVLTAANWPGGLNDLGVKLSAEIRGRGVAAEVRVDFRQVTSTPRDGRHISKLEVAVFVTDKSERPVGTHWDTLNLALKDETKARMLTDGFVHSVTVPVSDTARLVKVVVYDYATGRAGSALVRIY